MVIQPRNQHIVRHIVHCIARFVQPLLYLLIPRRDYRINARLAQSDRQSGFLHQLRKQGQILIFPQDLHNIQTS